MKRLRELSPGAKFKLPTAVALDVTFTVQRHDKGNWTFSDVVACTFQHNGRICWQTFSADIEAIEIVDIATNLPSGTEKAMGAGT